MPEPSKRRALMIFSAFSAFSALSASRFTA
jgi:hypothetical protein